MSGGYIHMHYNNKHYCESVGPFDVCSHAKVFAP